jgi:hypothetical protein
MERKIILFPQAQPTYGADPVTERETFFQELAIRELTKTIPQAAPQSAQAK